MVDDSKKPAPKRKKSATNTKPERVLRVAHGEGREALLEAVVRVVVRDGLSGVSYRAVAKEAGVTHGLVHYYFGSKHEMVGEAYKWALATEINEMHLRPEHVWVENFAERLAKMSDRDINLHLFLNEMVLDACRNPEWGEIVKPLFYDVFSAVEKSLKIADIPASKARARLIFAAIAGLTVQHLVFRSPKMTRETAAEFLQILQSLSAPKQG